MITVDIEKAKEIVKEKLRLDRKPLLEAQDVLFQRALETGTDTTEAQLKAKITELESGE